MDYRKYLGASEELVLPYLGGGAVYAPGRRLRLRQRPTAHGWFHFRVVGRNAALTGGAEAPDLSELPTVNGHLWAGNLVHGGGRSEPLELLPGDEPPRLSPCRARRWHSGDLIFEQLQFETDAEEAARRALEEGRGLSEVKEVPATLRAAFAYGLVDQASRQLMIPAEPAEVKSHLAEIADGGSDAARAVLRALAAERERARREAAEMERRRREALAAGEVRAERARRIEAARRSEAAAIDRAEAALEAAGARMRSARRLDGGNLEVIFTFMDTRFVTVADAATLQIVDSGICLGHPPRDELITLESLPGVIREAIETDQLVILRHA